MEEDKSVSSVYFMLVVSSHFSMHLWAPAAKGVM